MDDRRKVPQHLLVVGGTGMLRGATLALATCGAVVTVVARHAERLRELARAAAARGGQINPVAVDYRDNAALTVRLRLAAAAHGAIGHAVCWIHAVAPDAPLVITRQLVEGGLPCHYTDIIGSAGSDPREGALTRAQLLASLPSIRYRQVILGYARDHGRSRWLTHAEISAGVLQALATEAEVSVVGVVDPWSQRP